MIGKTKSHHLSMVAFVRGTTQLALAELGKRPSAAGGGCSDGCFKAAAAPCGANSAAKANAATRARRDTLKMAPLARRSRGNRSGMPIGRPPRLPSEKQKATIFRWWLS